MNESSDFDYRKYLQLVVKKKYLFVITALVIMTAVVIFSYLQPERYQAESTVFIEKSVISDLVKGIAVTPSIEERIRVLSYSIKSRTLLLKVFDDLDLNINKNDPNQVENMVKAFQSMTDVKLKDKEGLFIISFSHTDPRLARDYVNTLVRRYIEDNTSSKREESYGATRFIGEQIATLKQKLEESEAVSNNFRRSQGGILGQSEEGVLRDISDAQEKLNEASIKRRELESMLTLSRKNDPLQVKLSGLLRKQQDLSLVYTDQHPELVGVQNEIASVREQMKSGKVRAEMAANPSIEQERIRMELNSLRDTERNQQRLIAQKQGILRSIPAARTKLEEMEREKNGQKNLYEQLIARHGQSEVSKQMEVQDKSNTFRIVDPAVIPIKPISQPRIRLILLGIAGGLFGSLALLILWDRMDRSVRSLDTLKSLGVRILAVVPTIENLQEIELQRRRDRRFYIAAGAYFLCILATLPFELMRDLSFVPLDAASIKQGLSHMKNLTLK
ncbi:XrtA system polysaccharide chain length determinant [Pelotalea chapellei]|uniref:Chain-length determining protein n=1 Tax=Pelotalea chapellei TaxID=44671 RepID=A0ABS5U5B8_9BACT|nr:XrtA system polysaccharide chain length determinant [Pelotalea chapellei]MBT1070863.1 chain-length determining protein [Pelotalea chapellei]